MNAFLSSCVFDDHNYPSENGKIISRTALKRSRELKKERLSLQCLSRAKGMIGICMFDKVLHSPTALWDFCRYLKPLFKQLKRQTLPEDILEHLSIIVGHLKNRGKHQTQGEENRREM